MTRAIRRTKNQTIIWFGSQFNLKAEEPFYLSKMVRRHFRRLVRFWFVHFGSYYLEKFLQLNKTHKNG